MKWMHTGGVVICLALAACSERTESQMIETAYGILRNQVAADITMNIDTKNSLLNDASGEFYFVCGKANLNRPGEGPLALNDVAQRFIVTVNRAAQTGSGLFDGSSSADERANFETEWEAKCSPAA